jgi:5'-methylthioadenosine phosphorylase
MHDRKVEHIDFSNSLPLGSVLRGAASELGVAHEAGGVYVGGNGPRYETSAEVRAFGQIGDVVGMTASSEAVCFGEVGIPYGLICVVTNLGTGLSGELSHSEVVDVMKAKGQSVLEVLLRAVEMVE